MYWQSNWSPEDVKTLRDMWGLGRTAADIARSLKRTRSSVLGKLQRLGLTRRKGKERRAALSISPHKKCQYPHGDPRKAGFRFCGAPVQSGSSYCAKHHQECYLAPGVTAWGHENPGLDA